MDVKAINSVSLLNFEGTKERKKENKKHEYAQMDAPASKKANRGMRNAALGMILAAGLSGAALSSCTKEEAWATSESNSDSYSWVYGAGCNCGGVNDTTVIHDTITNTDTVIHTIVEPVFIKEFPAAICDSLIAQGLNIGIPLEGPEPGDGNVVFLASKALNKYDNKFYETKIDSTGTTKNQLSLVTKTIDLYDRENPKTSWMKTLVVDVPGKGIQLNRYTCNSDHEPGDNEQYLWKYSYSEIRSNGARSGNSGTNTIYDSDGNMIWKGQYTKGQEAGTFLYGTLAVDSDGNIYYDDDGNPELIQYSFANAKMWSDEITIEKSPATYSY